jgi:hypothetical protein
MAKKSSRPAQTVINDMRIEIRAIDRTRKDLQKLRNALLSAENIVRPVRQELYDIYEDIVLDDHLVSVMAQRRLAVTTSSIVFQKDGQPIDSINRLVGTEMFEEILEHILDARFWGFSLIKVDFISEKAEIVPRPHVVPLKGIVVQRPYDVDGIDYTLPQYTAFYLPAGKPKDLGLLLVAAALVYIKRGNLSDWAQFNEIFGQPLRVGEYDPNMPGQKEQMQEALKEAGAVAHMVIPTGAALKFVEANKSGASDTYNVMDERMEAAISKLIMGQTMTTENGSSRSQAEVHERVANKIAMSDRKFVLRYLNGALKNMLLAQGFTEAAHGEFQFVDEEELSKETMLKMDLDIHSQVGKLKKEYFSENYNVDFVDDSDEVDPQPAPVPEKQKPGEKPGRQQVKLGLNLLAQLKDFFA